MTRKQKKERARARCDRRQEYHDRVEALVNAVQERNDARMAKYETKNAVCAAFFNAYHGQDVKFPVTVNVNGVEWTVNFSSSVYWNEEWSGRGFYLSNGQTEIDVTYNELGYEYNHKRRWLDKPVSLDPPRQEDLKSARYRAEFTVQKEMGSQFI